MSKLQDLLDALCPNGVEYKALETACGFISGFAFKASAFTDSGAPICKTTNIQNNEISFQGMNCCNLSDYSENLDKYLIHPNDIVIGMSGTIKVGINRTPNCCYLNQRVGKFIPNTTVLKNKFLYYILCNSVTSLADGITGGSVKNLSNKDILQLSIPVPPLPVQEEIVRILDTFTALEAELEAELSARRKQYEFYREQLLTFRLPASSQNAVEGALSALQTDRQTDRQTALNELIALLCPNGVEFKTLGQIATISRGGNFQKKDFENSGIPCIHYGQIYTQYNLSASKTLRFISPKVAAKQKMAAKNDIIMAVTSENLDDVCKCIAWLGEDEVAISGHTAIIHHNQNAKYLVYWFHTAMFHAQKKQLAHGTKVIEVTPSKLEDVILPIPPLEVQEYIVSVLDKFDALAHDIEMGLPAEIAARRKQYEYYREKLLTFKVA